MTTCPHCDGKGTLADFAVTKQRGFYQPGRPCMLCGGRGAVSQQSARWYAQGLEHRLERRARHESLGEAARRLGVPVPEISRMEAGRADPAGLSASSRADRKKVSRRPGPREVIQSSRAP